MDKTIERRVLEEAKYIIKTKENIRNTAKYFNVSKSTVHKDIQHRLIKISPINYEKVENILKEHLKIRHIKGGEATKEKYAKKQ